MPQSTRRTKSGRRQFVGAFPALAASTVGIGACTVGEGPDHTGADAPSANGLPEDLKARSPFTLVLSSGGPRGFVHVGVIQALDELNIRPELVVGSSVGALVAALYCGGFDGNTLRNIALDLGPTKVVRIALGASQRLSGAPIASRVNNELNDRQLQDLPVACAIIAADQATRQPVAFTRGNAGVAVQASAAIENQFVPVSIRSRKYHDADLISPLPVRIARSLGAGRVLSVDASAHEDRAPAGAERFRAGDLRKRALTQPDASASDLNLHPDFGYWVSMSTEFRERAMRAGYEATLRQADRIALLVKT